MAVGKPRAPQKTHDEIFGEIMTGLGEALSFARGELAPGAYRVHVPVEVDVKAVRKKTGLSQDAFAGTFGFSPGTVRDWEQRRRMPDQAARMYLWAIGQRPDMMREILGPLTGTSAAARSRRSKPAPAAPYAQSAVNRSKRPLSRNLGH